MVTAMEVGEPVRVKIDRSGSRKRPAEDTEYAEWAKKLMTRAYPQVPIKAADSGPDKPFSMIPHSGFDLESAIGTFGWHTIGQDKYIPCLLRNGAKYCCIRMVEASVMGDLLHVLPQHIYDSAKLRSHVATAAEAKLLTYINLWHCDGYYGNAPFTEKDLVVTVQELEEFYSYLTFAYYLENSGGQNKENNFTRCGFASVNNDYLIPYTVLTSKKGGEKGIPLFYFEGKTEVLEKKAEILSGWDLAYLKICCRLQGVKKDLISDDTLKIITLSDLKMYLPKKTVFTEHCWLPPKKPRNAINKSKTK